MFLTERKAGVAPKATARIVLVAAICWVVPIGGLRGDEPKATVEVLTRADLRLTTTVRGTVAPIESVRVSSRAAGYVKSVQVDIGEAVRRGQVLAEIHAPELIAKREQLQAEVERTSALVTKARAAIKVVEASMGAALAQVDAARAETARAEAAIASRQKEQERLQGLSEKGAVEHHVVAEARDRLEAAQAAGATAKAQMLTVQAAVEENQARREAARADLMAAEAELKIVQAHLRAAEIHAQQCTLVAPLDGVVTQRSIHVGEFARPDETRGAPLLTIDRTDKVRVVLAVPDRDAPLLQPGEPATVQIDALPGREFPATIKRKAAAEDPATGTLQAEIELDNADGRLLPGLTGTVTIRLQDRHDVLTVPTSALIARDRTGNASCYRVVDGRAVCTRIKTGVEAGDRVEVCEGLDAGDRIVVHPGPDLKEGQKIEAAAPGDGRTENRREDVPKEPAPIRALIEERAATARQIVEEDMQRLKASLALPGDEVPIWSRRWMDEQIRLNPAPAERIAAIQAHLARLKELEQILDGYTKTGQGRVSDALKMKYYRLEAEQMLAEARALVGDIPPVVPSRGADEKGAGPSPRR
jgi:RND family efflux transporter MFP subunit